MKENDGLVLDNDHKSFKAITEFFEQFMVAYYSLKDWRGSI